MQKVETQPEDRQRLLLLSYSTLASIALSVILALTTSWYSANRGSTEIGNLRVEMQEIKSRMADRNDLQAVRDSLQRLEKDVKKVSDKLPKAR